MEYKEHIFGPGETIKGIIRKYNRQTPDTEIFETLWKAFCEANELKVPRVGDMFKIPLYDFGDTPPEPPKPQKPRLVYDNPNPPVKEPEPVQETFEVKTFTLEGSKIETSEEYSEEVDMDAMMERQKRREKQRRLNRVKVELPKELKEQQPKKIPSAPKPPVVEKPKKKETHAQTKQPTPMKKIPQPAKSVPTTKGTHLTSGAPIPTKKAPPKPITQQPIKTPVKRERKRLVSSTTPSRHRRR